MKEVFAAVLIAATCPMVVQSQAHSTWTIEALAGSGRHTERAGDVYYMADMVPMARLATTFAIAQRDRFTSFIEAELSLSVSGDLGGLCSFAPNGSCKKRFAESDGVGAGFGIRVAPGPRMTASAVLGGGSYAHQLRGFADGQVSIRALPHVALLANARYMRWSAGGAPHWYAPLSAGLSFF